jgi:hypothetical protein
VLREDAEPQLHLIALALKSCRFAAPASVFHILFGSLLAVDRPNLLSSPPSRSSASRSSSVR